MRVYISVDMEGIAGVVHESQTDPTTPAFAAEYARFRRLMTAEANAAVEGALAACATQPLVNSSHWFMRNLLAGQLHQWLSFTSTRVARAASAPSTAALASAVMRRRNRPYSAANAGVAGSVWDSWTTPAIPSMSTEM